MKCMFFKDLYALWLSNGHSKLHLDVPCSTTPNSHGSRSWGTSGPRLRTEVPPPMSPTVGMAAGIGGGARAGAGVGGKLGSDVQEMEISAWVHSSAE